MKIIKILLYSGYGAMGFGPDMLVCIISKQNNIDLTIVNDNEINLIKNFNDFDVIVFPGGNAYDQKMSLSGKTIYRIKKAVKNGLGYFGICAGAYLALNKEYGINLIDVPHECYDDCAIVKILFNNKFESDCVYDQGPIFSSHENNFATYKSDIEILNNKSPIIKKNVGKGIVILCGPHIEQMPPLENYVLFLLRNAINKK